MTPAEVIAIRDAAQREAAKHYPTDLPDYVAYRNAFEDGAQWAADQLFGRAAEKLHLPE